MPGLHQPTDYLGGVCHATNNKSPQCAWIMQQHLAMPPTSSPWAMMFSTSVHNAAPSMLALSPGYICACHKHSPWTLKVPPLTIGAWIMPQHLPKAVPLDWGGQSIVCFSCDDVFCHLSWSTFLGIAVSLATPFNLKGCGVRDESSAAMMWQPLPNLAKIMLQFDNLAFHHAHLLGGLVCIFQCLCTEGDHLWLWGTNFSGNGRSRGTTCSGQPFILWQMFIPHIADEQWGLWEVDLLLGHFLLSKK